MNPGDADLSDGGEELRVDGIAATDLLSELHTRLQFRRIALGAALVTLAALLLAMGATVWTFLHEFRTLAVDAQVDLVAAQRAPVASVSVAASAVAALVPAPAPLVVSLGGFTSAIAALVAALVVAATVLAIALVRASFTLAARGDDPARPAPESGDDAVVTLPTAEFVKAFGESLHTAAKGVAGPAR